MLGPCNSYRRASPAENPSRLGGALQSRTTSLQPRPRSSRSRNAVAASKNRSASSGSQPDSSVINAINRAIQLKTTYNIRVLNLSVGRPIFESYKNDPLFATTSFNKTFWASHASFLAHSQGKRNSKVEKNRNRLGSARQTGPRTGYLNSLQPWPAALDARVSVRPGFPPPDDHVLVGQFRVISKNDKSPDLRRQSGAAARQG